MTLERIFNIRGAYDLTRAEPKENYGIDSMKLYFAVKGPKGGVSALLAAAWYLPQNQAASYAMYTKGYPFNPLKELMQPRWWDISQHSKEPMYDEQTAQVKCELTDGLCYCDGTSLWGEEEWLLGFLHGGSDWLFERLEDYYRSIFDGGPAVDLTPIPRKHPKELAS